MTLTVGSLFSGIGGIDLGLERAGMTVRWQAETDPYASRVLAKHWPDVPNLGDVTTIDWENDTLDYGDGTARSLHVDLVAGGFPCQPVSLAGRGLAQLDARWLWPEFARCVRDLRPRLVLVENVPGLLVRGMGDVLGDLAASGYDAEWTGIPAAAVGAPHLRWRIFIVGTDTDRQRQPLGSQLDGSPVESGLGASQRNDPHRLRDPLADPEGSGLERGMPQLHRSGAGWPEPSGLGHESPRCGDPVADAEGIAVGPGLCEGDAGGLGVGRPGDLSGPSRGWWTIEPDVGRVAHGIPSRVDRLRCLGNAVVPQVAEFVGRQIMAAEVMT